MRSGVDGRVEHLLVKDAHLASADALEDVCSALLSGDVQNLYRPEDAGVILGGCAKLCEEQGAPVTRANAFAFYAQRVKAFLHVILAMSPASHDSQWRLRMFPGLLRGCTPYWVREWPHDAYIAVAEGFLSAQGIELATSACKHGVPRSRCSYAQHSCADDRGEHGLPLDFGPLLGVAPAIHEAGQLAARRDAAETGRPRCKVTSAVFVECVRSVTPIAWALGSHREQLMRSVHRANRKAEEVAGQGWSIQVAFDEVVQKQHALQAEADGVAKQLQQAREESYGTRDAVLREDRLAQEEADKCSACERWVQQEFDAVAPALEQVYANIHQLKESHIREIKSMTHPPANVVVLMTAVCILFGVPPTKSAGGTEDDYMAAAQHSLLRDPKRLLEDLVGFDKEHIDEARITQIQPLLDEGHFDTSAMRRTSQACEVISAWVRIMYDYHFLFKRVEEKRGELREATSNSEAAEAKLQRASEEYARAHVALDRLQAKHDHLAQQQEALEKEVEEHDRRVKAIRRLAPWLEEQCAAWRQWLEELRSQQQLLAGDAVLCAAMVAYGAPLGTFTRQEFGRDMVSWAQTAGIQHSLLAGDGTLKVQQAINEPGMLLDWQVCGLPCDPDSIENAALMEISERWPLMVDPQHVGSQLIKRLGGAGLCDLAVCTAYDPGLLRAVEVALGAGTWLLIEEVSARLGGGLDQLLARNWSRQPSGGWEVKLGSKVVPWSAGFRLFLASSSAVAPLPHQLCAALTVIDFSITPAALEERLRSAAQDREGVGQERRDVELAASITCMRRDLARREEATLQMLACCEGVVLQDDAQTRALLAHLDAAEQLMSADTVSQHTTARDDATPLAKFLADLFRLTARLECIDPMYQFSLQWLEGLVANSVSNLAGAARMEPRMNTIRRTLARKLLSATARAISQAHRLPFALCVVLKIQGEKQRSAAELEFLITGASAQGELPPTRTERPSFLTSGEWAKVESLSALPGFDGLAGTMGDEPGWQHVYNALEPWTATLPEPWESRLDAFGKLCLFRAFDRPDCIARGAYSLVADELGPECADAPLPSLSACLAESSCLIPLVFLLSDDGEDPVASVASLGRAMHMDGRVESVSLGTQQGAKATRMLEEGSKVGSWVFVRDCHMLPSWMPELARVFGSLDARETHADFRLWLSTSRCLGFPRAILQAGVKISTSQPTALRASLHQGCTAMANGVLAGTSATTAHRRLAFGLCFFHVVVTERARLASAMHPGLLRITLEDVRLSLRELGSWLEEASGNGVAIPCRAFQRFIAGVHYGGRVADDQGRRFLETLAQQCLCLDLADDPGYPLGTWLRDSALYTCPQAKGREDILACVRSCPSHAEPWAFGLHGNVMSASQVKQGSELLGAVRTLLLREHPGARPTRQPEDDQLLTARRMLARIPPFPDEAAACSTRPHTKQCVEVVLRQEVCRYGSLLRVVTESLRSFEAVFQGEQSPMDRHDAFSDSFQKGSVPQVWADAGYLSEKSLASWFEDLMRRLSFITDWVAKGPPPTFWLPGFCAPQSMAAAVLQDHARRAALPIDAVEFSFKVLPVPQQGDLPAAPPSEGCYFHGLFLEGCRWCDEVAALTNASPREPAAEMPVVWFLPRRVGDAAQPAGRGLVYDVPLYKVPTRGRHFDMTGRRSNHVLDMQLPCRTDVAACLLADMALLLSLAH